MSLTSIGDLARTTLLQRRNTSLKSDVQRLGNELTSGQTDDIAAHLGGSYSRLSTIERDMRVLKGFSTTQAEVTQFADTMQNSLERIRNEGMDLARNLLLSRTNPTAATKNALAISARSAFETMVATLNTQTAGRSLFAGDGSDQVALADANTIFSALSTVVAGATDATTAIAAVENWFSDPAGFATVGYLGSATSRAPLQISKTASVDLAPRADNPEVVEMLKGAALAALIAEPGFPLDNNGKSLVLNNAADKLLDAQDNFVALQSRLGASQEQISKWTTRTKSELAGLEYTKGALLAVDPYETATKLEAARFQLESLYAITVKLSNLSLVNHLR